VEFVELSDGVRLSTWTTVADLMNDLTVVHRFDQRGCGGSEALGSRCRWLRQWRRHRGPASAVESLASHVPNAELHLIKAAGHDPWREDPSEFRTIRVNFLERVG
jgi:pimeloyl-ACP methyl ester carboxylesterase